VKIHLFTTHSVPRFICLVAFVVCLCLAGTACGKKEPPKPPTSASNGADQQAAAGQESGQPPKPGPAAGEAEKQYAAGVALMEKGQYKEAITNFTLAIDADKESAKAYLQRGICLKKLVDPAAYALANRGSAEGYRPAEFREEAAQDISRAAELMPDDENALFLKAMTLYECVKYDEAEKAFAALVEKFPKNAKGHYFLGFFAERRRDLVAAFEQMNAAVGNDAGYEDALAERACLYAILEDFDKALADIAKARQADAAEPRFRLIEGVVHLMRGRLLMDRATLEGDTALAERATADFKEAENILAKIPQLADLPDIPAAIACAESIASQSNEAAPRYEGASKEFEKLLAAIESGVKEKRGESLLILVPRLQRDLAVTDMARKDQKSAVERLKLIVEYARDFAALWEQSEASLLDKWLTYRVICDAMHSLAQILVGAENDYATAETYLKALLDFQGLVKADYGSAAATRKKERETIQEGVYECEYHKIVSSPGARYTYEQCVKFLAHPYYRIRAFGLACLSQKDEPDCREKIVAGLDDPDERVVAVAARIAGDKGIGGAVPKLAAAVKKCGPEGAIAAAEALRKLLKKPEQSGTDVQATPQMQAAIPALIDALENADQRVREAAMLALQDLTGRTQLYRYDDTPEKRAEAVRKWREWWKEIMDAAKNNGGVAGGG